MYNMEEVLAKATADGYSRDEVENMIAMGTRLAAKAIITHVVDCVRAKKTKSASAKCTQNKLIDDLTAIMPATVGYISMKITDDVTLCASLTSVAPTYRSNAAVPDEGTAAELYNKYNFLKQVASAYWQQFQVTHAGLYRRLIDFRGDVDFNVLVIDSANPTTMYFDAALNKRVGIFCYALVDGQIKMFES